MLAEKSLSASNSPRNSLYKRHRMSLPISRAYANPYFSSREETGVMLAKLIKYYARNPETSMFFISKRLNKNNQTNKINFISS